MSKRYRDDNSGVTQAMEYDTRHAGSGVAMLSWVIALLWVAAAAGFTYFGVGPTALTVMRPEMLAGIAVISLLPALLILFAGAAAREGARARAQSHVLSAAAEKMLNPAPAAEAAVRRLSAAVRGEIDALEAAIEKAMARARDVEEIITRQTQAVEGAAYHRQNSAAQLLEGMERERTALLSISDDLNRQAATIGNSISRHAASINEAAEVAQNDIRIADGELNARMASFGAATSKIGERTGALTKAAQVSAELAHRLESILGGALDALTKATSLTDAARQSAEAATHAANNTAGAMRETTQRAIEDAKRTADLIRAESANVEKEAAVALSRLHEAAEAARFAAQNVRAISTETAAEVSRAATRPAAEPARREPEDAPRYFLGNQEQPLSAHDLRNAQQRTAASAQPQQSRQPQRDDIFTTTPDGVRPLVTLSPRPPSDPGPAPGGAWTWRDVLASADDTHVVPFERQRPSGAGHAQTTSHGALAVQRIRHPIEAVNVIDAVGINISELFEESALNRVAQRARNGAHARRRAVRDAASDAVNAVAEYLNRDPDSRAAVSDFLRSEGPRLTELLGRGRASMTADATRAFLLLDAACG